MIKFWTIGIPNWRSTEDAEKLQPFQAYNTYTQLTEKWNGDFGFDLTLAVPLAIKRERWTDNYDNKLNCGTEKLNHFITINNNMI